MQAGHMQKSSSVALVHTTPILPPWEWEAQAVPRLWAKHLCAPHHPAQSLDCPCGVWSAIDYVSYNSLAHLVLTAFSR